MLRKKVFLYVSFVKSVQFVCAIIYRKINRFHQKIYTIFSIFYFNRTLRALIPDIHVEDFMPVEIEPVPQRQRSHVLPVRFCQVAV